MASPRRRCIPKEQIREPGFAFSSEHEAVRDTVRRLSRRTRPLVFEAEEQEAFPRRVFERWGELGLLGVRYQSRRRQRPGQGQRLHCARRTQLSVAGIRLDLVGPHPPGIWPIWKAGTPAQKAASWPRAVRREGAGFGLSEPDGGSNVRAMKTRAERVEGGWRLHGSKLYITNAPFADFLLVAARTSAALKPESISLFIVELPNAGFDIAQAEEGRHTRIRNRADPYRQCVRAR